MRLLNLLSSLAITPLAALLPLSAVAETAAYQIPDDGKLGKAKFTAEHLAYRDVLMWFELSGKESLFYDFEIHAPANAKVSITQTVKGKSALIAALTDKKSAWEVAFTPDGGKERNSYTFPIPQSLTAAENQLAQASVNRCAFLPESAIQQLLLIYKQIYGRDITREEFCNGDSSSGNNGNNNNNGSEDTLFAKALLHVNSCAKSSYLVGVRLDLTAVTDAAFTQGFEVAVAAKPRKHRGEDASTIKPYAEGLYAGEPILLMSSLGSYGASEKVNLVQWKKNKPGKIKKLPVVKYVYYRGLYLALARLRGLLKGGKATFELTNGDVAYSVCFKLAQTRQRANGYPG